MLVEFVTWSLACLEAIAEGYREVTMHDHSHRLQTNCELHKLKRLATEFRVAIENCERVRAFIATFRRFPHGSCGEAILLLAKYLEENGCGTFDYILGNRDGYSHAWLQQRNIIVDITADQFDDNHDPVIVGVDNSWHCQFDGKFQNIADINIYDENFKLIAWAAYGMIIEAMNSAQKSET